MKLAIVTGSRNWSDESAIYSALDDEQPHIVVAGACRGADKIAAKWCHDRGVDLVEVPALFGARGKKAGPARNSFMAKLVYSITEGWPGEPNHVVVIAAPLQGSRGTKDMIAKCKYNCWRIVTVNHG